MNPVAVQFTGDSKPFFAELNKVRNELSGFRGEMKRVSDSVSSMFKGLLVGVGFVSAIREVARATAESEAAQAQLNNALQAAGAHVKLASAEFQVYASQLQRTTTFSDEAIMQVETLLLSFKGLTGDVVKQATASVLDLSTRMGIDAPAAAKLLGKALQDPEKGLTTLARAGVVFSDGQKEQIKAMKESGDLAGAQSRILKELEDRFGGAAAAARDTFGGALSGLKNAFGDLLEGKSGMKEATQEINKMTDILSSPEVQSAFNIMIAGLTQIVSLAGQYAALVGNGARGWQIMLTGSGGNEFVDLDNQIRKLADEKKALEKTFQLPNGERDLYAEKNFKADKARLEAIKLEIFSLTAQRDIAGERARQVQVYGKELQYGMQAPKGGAMDFTTGGAPSEESDTENQAAIDKRQKAALKLAEEEYEGRQAVEELITSLHQDELDKQFQADVEYLQLSQKLGDDAYAQMMADNSRNLDGIGQYYADQYAMEVKAKQKELDLNQETQNIIQAQRAVTVNAALNLLATLGQRHKAFAIASILIEKMLAVKRLLFANAQAAQLAFASQLVPSMPWTLATAQAAQASVLAQGRLAAGLVLAEGGLQISSQFGGGGGGSTIVAPSTGVSNGTLASGDEQRGVAPQRVLNVIFNGPVYENSDFKDHVIQAIREEIDDRDVLIIGGNSRQAQEIRGG